MTVCSSNLRSFHGVTSDITETPLHRCVCVSEGRGGSFWSSEVLEHSLDTSSLRPVRRFREKMPLPFGVISILFGPGSTVTLAWPPQRLAISESFPVADE